MTPLAHIAPIAAASLAAAIWQGAVLALCVAAVLRFVPGITASARSLIWSAVFILAVALPFARFGSTASLASASHSTVHLDARWAMAVAALWVVLSTLRALRLMQSAVRLYHVVSRATPVVVSPAIAAVAAVANVDLCTSRDVDVPSVAGFFHRRIILPAGLVDKIAPTDLYKIVLHELEHLRRRDDWTNLLQKVALVLFPLNPVLLWVERRLCLERELACDDGVLQATDGAGKAYATCLANLAEASLLHRGMSLALGAWQRQSELAHRVHRILRSPAREMKPFQSAALAMGVLSAVVGTGVLAARSPQLLTFRAASAGPSFAGQATSIQAVVHPVPEVLVKASMMPHPGLLPAALHVPRRHVGRRRSVTAVVRRYSARTNVVLIGWQPEEFRARRWTSASPGFQLTYAAVPTRTGWLFFQL